MGAAVEVHYARSDGADIAYRVLGEGPRNLLLFSPWIVPIDAMDEEPRFARFLRRLGSLGRLVCFDRRGVGLSDPVTPANPPTIEQWMTDALAVLDAVGSSRTVVLGVNNAGGGTVAILLAASHPDRVESLVLVHATARTRWAPDYAFGYSDDRVQALLDDVERNVRQGGSPFDAVAPTLAGDAAVATWWKTATRRGGSPSTARLLSEIAYRSDVRHVLPTIQVPTLVMHRGGNRFLPIAHGRYLADHIPGARFVELDGIDHLSFLADPEPELVEIEAFLTGLRPAPAVDRVLVTVVFTDIAGSTTRVAAVGDHAWRATLDDHDAIVRAELTRFRGREVKMTGDGVLAMFDGPARAVEFARAVRDGARRLGLDVRAGVHTGEVEVRGADVTGLAVHIGERVCGLAEPGAVLVSRTVVDLVAGSGLAFHDRGEHELRGVPGTWRLFVLSEPDAGG